MNIHLRVFQSGVSRGQLGCHFKPTIGGLSNQPPYRLLQHKLSGSLCWRCSPPTKSVRNNIFFPRHALTNAWRSYTSNAGKLGEKYGQKTSSSKSVNLSGMKRLLTLAKPERWKLGGAVCLLLVSSGVSMFVPFGIGKVIDMISEQLRSPSEADKDVLSSRLNSFCGTLVVIFVVGGICNAGRVYLMSVVGQRIARSLRQKVYNAILKQETAFFDRNKTGELVSRLSSDSLIVSSTLTTNVSDGLRSSISVVAGLTMMFYTSTQLSLITLTGVVPPIAFLLVVVGRYIRNINKKVQDSLAKANQVAEERFSNIRVVKTFGHESHERALFSQKLEELVQLAYKEAKVRAGFFGMTGLSGNLMAVSALYFGSPMLANNSITVGQLSSFLLYAAYVSLSISGITGVWGDLNKGLGAGARLWELLDRQPAILSTGGLIPQHAPKGHLEFRDVTFAYPTRPDVEVLQNLSLTLPTGAMTAVVGGSGSGKSTLAALLLRLYDPTTGQIFLDGHLLSDLNWTWLRKHVSYVSQEPVLFSCSIRENIAYGAVSEGTFYNGASQSLPSVTDEQIWGVADIANAKDFISRLPEGLDTVVGERGISLSGGQRQRVAIARALLRNPKVLLLDEATSALDAESERLVQDALEKVMQGRTVLTIAHRLSTVRNADQIAVLDQGRVIELGSYDQLMSKEDSAFHKLVRLQTFQQFSIVS